ncbi:MAG TPA: DUF1707 domain-containing protein [Micromonosporaceae bacterium]|jgi:hypothetical protein|nr:DUF1707 domain-containing protein [Micromonosporaceae bacterium]
MAADTPDAPHDLPQLRVSDAERDAIVVRLNEATSEGRLTLEEFSDRASAALAARTQADLDTLVADLPATHAHVATYVSPAVARVAQITPVGSVKRSGRWRIDRDMEIGAIVGSVKLDLRQAEVAASVVDMHVRVTLGSVKIWIPRGISVTVDGNTVLGSRSIADDAPQPGAPLLRLHVDTVVGSVKVYRR